MVEGVKARGIGGPPAATRDNTTAAEGRFLVEDSAEPSTQRAGLSSVVALGLESMLALQGVDDTADRDRGARKRGTAMIASLTDLQRALLGGEDPAAALRALNELAAGDAE